DEIAGLDFGPALQKAGMTLVMKVGGASGPLYGSGLMAMGKAATGVPANPADVAALLNAAIDAIKARGKSDVGAKTMLDLLVPVAQAIAAGGADAVAAARKTAEDALESTRPMKATKGRASFLGDRSIGHLDPGARSSTLLVNAVCDVVEGQ
ncbi:MAG: dihydroxyacetone kinase subunit L, partial [Rhodobiaceae bacterium]|nr:dihydroxyacetone kinase subunit L [Rhodobiaceae bacterium]